MSHALFSSCPASIFSPSYGRKPQGTTHRSSYNHVFSVPCLSTYCLLCLKYSIHPPPLPFSNVRLENLLILKRLVKGVLCWPSVRIPGFHCSGLGSVPGWGTEIQQAMWHNKKRLVKISLWNLAWQAVLPISFASLPSFAQLFTSSSRFL